LYLLLLAYSPLLRVKWFSDRTRRLTKTANRPMRRIAGTRLGMLYFNLGALHHIGRRSGRTYVTPLSAYRLGDGFVLGVAYPEVDWCRNVLAAGKCTLTWNGKEYALERPELIPAAEAMKAYPLLVKPFIVGPGTKTFLWLHPADMTQSEEEK
jgi:deazaflavin-dependent oxidoreductase (nitroreductase family)